MTEIIIGIVFVFLGVFYLWRTIKHPTEGRDVLTTNFKGYILGIALIVVGIMLIIGKLNF